MNSVKLQDTRIIYTYLAFLDTNNKLSEKENKKTIPFKNHIKKNKTHRNKLNQGGERSIRWKL